MLTVKNKKKKENEKEIGSETFECEQALIFKLSHHSSSYFPLLLVSKTRIAQDRAFGLKILRDPLKTVREIRPYKSYFLLLL